MRFGAETALRSRHGVRASYIETPKHWRSVRRSTAKSNLPSLQGVSSGAGRMLRCASGNRRETSKKRLAPFISGVRRALDARR